jgi:hypothetical protein
MAGLVLPCAGHDELKKPVTQFRDSNFKQQISDARPQSRGAMRPRLAETTRPKKKGVGNAGRTVHPQPRVQGWSVERTRVVTVAPESPGIPARNGLTAYIALSPVTGLSCHRHP